MASDGGKYVVFGNGFSGCFATREEAENVIQHNGNGSIYEKASELEALRVVVDGLNDILDDLRESHAKLAESNAALSIARDKEFWRNYADETCKTLQESNAKLTAALAARTQ